MKTIISKILITGTIIATLALNVQAGPTRPMTSDTGKMSKKKMDKMDKMGDKKMDKMGDKKMDKMGDKKMSKMKKDSSKMSKM